MVTCKALAYWALVHEAQKNSPRSSQIPDWQEYSADVDVTRDGDTNVLVVRVDGHDTLDLRLTDDQAASLIEQLQAVDNDG